MARQCHVFAPLYRHREAIRRSWFGAEALRVYFLTPRFYTRSYPYRGVRRSMVCCPDRPPAFTSARSQV